MCIRDRYSIDLSNKMNNKYYDSKKKESIVKDKINFVKGTLVTIKDGNIGSYTTDITKIAELLSVKEEK